VTYAGGTGSDTLNVNAGTFTLAQDAFVASQSLFINVANATLVMNASQHLAGLKIQSSGRATLAANGSRVLVTSQVDATGKLDLTDNRLIVQATADNRQQVLASVQTYIRNAFNTSPIRWQGNGITSSTAAANAARAVGVLLNSSHGTTYETFAGEGVNENSVLVAYTVVGDLNLDRAVSISDFITLASHFGSAGGWGEGDVNYDGQVTISDFIDVASNFNQQLAAEQIELISQAPASLALAGQSDDPEVLTVTRSKRPKDLHDHRRPRLHHRSPKRRATAQWRSRAGAY